MLQNILVDIIMHYITQYNTGDKYNGLSQDNLKMLCQNHVCTLTPVMLQPVRSCPTISYYVLTCWNLCMFMTHTLHTYKMSGHKLLCSDMLELVYIYETYTAYLQDVRSSPTISYYALTCWNLTRTLHTYKMSGHVLP